MFKLKYKFRNLSIKNRTTIFVALIFSVVVVINIFFFSAHEEKQITEFMQSKAQNTMKILSSTISLALDEQNYKYADNLFSILRNDSSIVYIGLLDESGSIISVSYVQNIKLPQLNTFSSNTFFEENNILHTSRKIRLDEGIEGYLVIGFSVAERDLQISKVWQLGLWVNIGILFLTILFYLYLNRLITKPLINFVENIRNITKTQDYSKVIEVTNSDEIGMLKDAFNTLNSKVYKQTEELLNSRAQLNAILETIGEGVITINEHGNIILANQECIDIFGYKREELIGKNLTMLIPEKYRSKHIESLNNYVKTGNTRIIGKRVELEGIRSDKTIFPLELKIVETKIGIKQFFTGSIRDITNRKLAEERLRQQAILVKQNPAPVFRAKYDGTVITANPAAEEIFHEDLIGKSIYSLFTTIENPVVNSISKTKPIQLIEQIGSKNFLFTVKKDEETKSLYFFGSDISDQIRNEGELKKKQLHLEQLIEKKTEQLRESEEHFRGLFENSTIGIYRSTSEGKSIMSNPKLLELMGFSSTEELQNANMYDIYINPAERDKFKNLVEQDGTVYGIESEWKRPDGTRIFVQESARVVKDKNGKVLYYEGTVEDITERKIAEEALKESEKHLRELIATKDKFFSIISHDLRAPFQALLSISDFFANDIDNMTKQEIIDFASDLNQSAENLYELLNNLLDWSRVQAGKMKYEPREIHLKKSIDKVIHMLTANAHNKHISLTSNISEDLIVYVDKNMLNSVVQNLVSNAIKFTNKGGEIKVMTDVNDEFAEVAIADNGVGMDKDTLEKLFRLDTRVTSPGTKNERGTGLGLILCKELIEKCGGKIWVESELNKGSTFHFTLKRLNVFHKN